MTSAKYVTFCGTSVLVAALVTACEGADPGAQATVRPTVVLIDRADAPLTAGAIRSLNGTYTNCLAASGSWSVAAAPNASLTHPALVKLQADTTCVLTLTEVVAEPTGGQPVPYTTTPGIVLGGAYAPGSVATFQPSGGGPAQFYANARLVPTVQPAQPGFNIELSYSDDPSFGQDVLSVPAAGVYHFAGSGAVAASTSYQLDTDGANEENTADDFGFAALNGVTTVVGTATLTGTPPPTLTVEGYVVSLAALTASSTFAEVEAAYAAASPTVQIGDPIDGTAITTLLATPDPDATTASVIIRAHDIETGVRTYQVILLKFGSVAPPQTPACSAGAPVLNCACNSPLQASSGFCCAAGETWNGTACAVPAPPPTPACQAGTPISSCSCNSPLQSSSGYCCAAGQTWDGTACALPLCQRGDDINGCTCTAPLEAHANHCCSVGETWDGSACTTPAPPTPTLCQRGDDINGCTCTAPLEAHSNHCCNVGEVWDGSACTTPGVGIPGACNSPSDPDCGP